MDNKKRRMRERLMYQLLLTNTVVFIISYFIIIVVMALIFKLEKYEFYFAKALFHPAVTISSILFISLFTPIIDRFSAKLRMHRTNYRSLSGYLLILFIYIVIAAYIIIRAIEG